MLQNECDYFDVWSGERMQTRRYRIRLEFIPFEPIRTFRLYFIYFSFVYIFCFFEFILPFPLEIMLLLEITYVSSVLSRQCRQSIESHRWQSFHLSSPLFHLLHAQAHEHSVHYYHNHNKICKNPFRTKRKRRQWKTEEKKKKEEKNRLKENVCRCMLFTLYYIRTKYVFVTSTHIMYAKREFNKKKSTRWSSSTIHTLFGFIFSLPSVWLTSFMR